MRVKKIENGLDTQAPVRFFDHSKIIEIFQQISGSVITIQPEPLADIPNVPSARAVNKKLETMKRITETELRKRAQLANHEELMYLKHYNRSTEAVKEACQPDPLSELIEPKILY